MPRSPARRPRLPQIRAYGHWLNQGPRIEDAVSGWEVPIKDCIKQRGRLVSRDYKDGSRDREDSY